MCAGTLLCCTLSRRTLYVEVSCPTDTLLRSKLSHRHFTSKQIVPLQGGQSTLRGVTLLRRRVSGADSLLRSKVSGGGLLRSNLPPGHFTSGGKLLRDRPSRYQLPSQRSYLFLRGREVQRLTSVICYPSSVIRHPTSDIRHPTSDIRHRHPSPSSVTSFLVGAVMGCGLFACIRSCIRSRETKWLAGLSLSKRAKR